VASYLSPAWFDEVDAAVGPVDGQPDLILQQVVLGGPEGDVRYRIEVREGRATLSRGTTGDPDMTFTSDYRTAAAIACGELSTQAALLEGRIRVAGNPVQLAERHGQLGTLDPVPSAVRAGTTYR
jgi:alkyl sulfatase BDS1-like metallo-beta-lactamase superfamily hydrolase